MLTALLTRIHEQVCRQWKHKVSWDGLSFVELWVYKCIDGTLNESKPDWKSNKRRIDWKTEWKKTEHRGRTQGLCFFVCLHFYGTGVTVCTWSWKYPSPTDWTKSALCVLCSRKEHVATLLTILLILLLHFDPTSISLASHLESHSSVLQSSIRQHFHS